MKIEEVPPELAVPFATANPYRAVELARRHPGQVIEIARAVKDPKLTLELAIEFPDHLEELVSLFPVKARELITLARTFPDKIPLIVKARSSKTYTGSRYRGACIGFLIGFFAFGPFAGAIDGLIGGALLAVVGGSLHRSMGKPELFWLVKQLPEHAPLIAQGAPDYASEIASAVPRSFELETTTLPKTTGTADDQTSNLPRTTENQRLN